MKTNSHYYINRKNIFMNKARKHFTSLFALLLLFFTVSPSAFALDEEEAGQWKSIGTGKLVDGWVMPYLIGDNYKNFPLDVEIQQYKGDANIYRIWQPYKNIMGVIDNAVAEGKAKRSTVNEIGQSEYQGQIIFDITDPDYVKIGDFRNGDRIGNSKPAGVKVTKGGNPMYSTQFGFEGELYASTAYSYFMNQGMPESLWYSNYGKTTYPITYNDSMVSVSHTFSVDSNLSGPYMPRNYPAYIYFPEDYTPGGDDEPEVGEGYRWEDIVSYPDNKYYLVTFDTQSSNEPELEAGGYAPFPQIGDIAGYPAQIIKNYEIEDGQKVLRIYLTQLYRNDPYVGNFDWRPHFMIAKNSNNTCYPADFSSLGLDDGVHAITPESGKKYVLSKTTYPIVSVSGDSWLSHDHFLMGEKWMFDVVITIYFDSNDTTYETPLAIKFDYKDSAPKDKAFFIGSLAKTSPLYDEDKDKLEGYMTKVPFETTDYPFTYTFKAEEEEYEFIVFHKYPYWISQGQDYYQMFLRAYDYDNYRFHNEIKTGGNLEPITGRVANDLEEGTINRYPGYNGLPHKDTDLGKNYKNSIHYTPFHLKNLELGKIYQIKFDQPDLLYDLQPTYDWVFNSELDDYFNEKGIDISNLKDYYASFGIDVILPGEEERFDESYITYDLSKNPRDLTDEEVNDVKRVPLAKRLDRDARYQVLKGFMYKINNSFLNLYYTEYTPVPNTYQLVQATKLNNETGSYEGIKDNNGNDIYYTYDFTKETGNTYMVTLDKANKVASYKIVTEIDQQAIDEDKIYQDQNYRFSDMLFIVSDHPAWIKSAYVNDKITGILGVINFNESKETVNFDTTDSFDPEHLHEIVKINNVDGPIDNKEFSIDYSYTYSNSYQSVHRSMFDTTLPMTADVNYLVLGGVNNYFTGELETNPFSKNEKDKYQLKRFSREDIVMAPASATLSTNIPPREAAIKRDSRSTVAIGSTLELKNPVVETAGKLSIPEPLSHSANYELITDRVVEPQKNMTLRFYADDLQKNYSGQHSSTTYLEREYMLPENLYLHAHDYHVRLPYTPSNVTEDLGNIMLEQRVSFNASVNEKQSITKQNEYKNSVLINPLAEWVVPGFYNADMEDIYKDYESKKNSPTTRSLTISKNGEFEIYSRNYDELAAEVTLKLTGSELNTNPVFYNFKKDQDDNTVITNVYKEVVPNGDDTNSLVIAMPGIDVLEAKQTGSSLNGSDYLKNGDYERDKYLTAEDFIDAEAKANGNLTPEEFFKVDDPEYTTLYLVEFDVPTLSKTLSPEDGAEVKVKLADNLTLDNDKKHYIKLLTRDELLHYRFPVVVLDQNYTGSTDNLGGVTLKMTDYVPEDFTYNFTVRNVYLFPEDNIDFMDEASADLHKGDAKTDSRKKAVDTTKGVKTTTYHALTPVATEHTLVVTNDDVTAVEEVNADERGALLRVEGNMIELLDDDVMLFNVNGALIASGRQTIHVAPDVYIAVAGRRVQKVAIR